MWSSFLGSARSLGSESWSPVRELGLGGPDPGWCGMGRDGTGSMSTSHKWTCTGHRATGEGCTGPCRVPTGRGRYRVVDRGPGRLVPWLSYSLLTPLLPCLFISLFTCRYLRNPTHSCSTLESFHYERPGVKGVDIALPYFLGRPYLHGPRSSTCVGDFTLGRPGALG